MKNRQSRQIAYLSAATALAVILQSTDALAWGGHNRDDHQSRGRHHSHNHHYGQIVRFPEQRAVIVGGGFYYYGGIFCKKHNGVFIVIEPPIGTIIASIPIGSKRLTISGRTYHCYNDVYYVKRPDGYLVVQDPYQAPMPKEVRMASARRSDGIDSSLSQVDINIPNENGSYTTVTITKSGSGYTGPQGEFYPDFPKVAQLKVMYGNDK